MKNTLKYLAVGLAMIASATLIGCGGSGGGGGSSSPPPGAPGLVGAMGVNPTVTYIGYGNWTGTVTLSPGLSPAMSAYLMNILNLQTYTPILTLQIVTPQNGILPNPNVQFVLSGSSSSGLNAYAYGFGNGGPASAMNLNYYGNSSNGTAPYPAGVAGAPGPGGCVPGMPCPYGAMGNPAAPMLQIGVQFLDCTKRSANVTLYFQGTPVGTGTIFGTVASTGYYNPQCPQAMMNNMYRPPYAQQPYYAPGH